MNISTKISNPANYTRSARSLSSINYIVIHYTGNKGDTAKNNADYFARECVGVSAHYFVDETEVWCSVSPDHNAWHCGTKTGYYHKTCRNNNSIGVEICMLNKNGKVRHDSIKNAAAFVKKLMTQYNIPIENVIRHYDVTHKQCPAPMVSNPSLWEEFKESLIKEEDEDMDVNRFKELWSEMRKELQDNDSGTWSAGARQWAVDNGLIAGNGTTIDGQPNYMWADLLTREQLVSVLFRFAQMMSKA